MTISVMKDLPDNVLGLAASGEIEDDDYEDTVIPAVEELLQRHDTARILYLLDEDFERFEADAMWEDTKMGLHHFGKWERIALVTDHKGYRRAVKTFGFLMPGEVKAFELDELEAAKTWISS